MQSDELTGDRFGAHRVLEPKGALPQAAERVDNDFTKAFDCEILISVDTLNIDAASFRQMSEASGGAMEGVGEIVRGTVARRGKQHNPVTGSGGMLLGTVKRVGSKVRAQVKPGDRIATLVSLTLTPLRIDALKEVRPAAAQLDVTGEAVIFDSGVFAVLPGDFSQRVALAALDVCGAPAQVSRGCSPGQRVLILGAGGKSGLLCASEARKRVGAQGRVIGVEPFAKAAAELTMLGLCDEVLTVDARDPLAVRNAALAANAGNEYDLVVSCVNIEGAELAAILCTRERGRVFFFAMTTHFGRAALGAEGVGKDVDMLIGNGYAEGHAELTLALLRENNALRGVFERRYG
jgi:L-erythro-3,5-diaminohexanoate dehydrogenase